MCRHQKSGPLPPTSLFGVAQDRSREKEDGIMRKQLAKIQDGKKHTFKATMARYGSFVDRETGKRLRTILLTDIRDDTGRVLTDHAWVREDSYLKGMTLVEGVDYTFEARVGIYDRGCTAKDYRLARIRKMAAA